MKQKVYFNEKVNVRPIWNRHDITPSEKCKAWYNKDELDILLKLSVDDECKRGLDELLSRERRSDCALVIRYVLREQRRQKSLGYRDADLLAAYYTRVTTKHWLTAIKTGEMDFKNAQYEIPFGVKQRTTPIRTQSERNVCNYVVKDRIEGNEEPGPKNDHFDIIKKRRIAPSGFKWCREKPVFKGRITLKRQASSFDARPYGVRRLTM